MTQTIIKRASFIVVTVVLSLCILGCKAKIAAPEPPAPSTEILKLIAQGDAFFAKSHLYGWRQSEKLYEKAYSLSPTDELARKLEITRLLIMIRQSEEDIPTDTISDVVENLCSINNKHYTLCQIGRWYADGTQPEMNSDSPHVPRFMDLPWDSAALHSYLNILFNKTARGGELPSNWESTAERYKESPLFLYLGFEEPDDLDWTKIIDSNPQFAEAFRYYANKLFFELKFNSARNYYLKAINLIPDYTSALIGLGDIYIFGVDDPIRALNYYESALSLDPSMIEALFGKGLALYLHQEYEESNKTFDKLLALGISHYNRLSAASYRYYKGQSLYYKANNMRTFGDSVKARELIDMAKQYLPDSDEILLLSGELYFEKRDMESARREFNNIPPIGDVGCNAQYYLGMVYHYFAQAPNPGERVKQINEEQNEPDLKSSVLIEGQYQLALRSFLVSSRCLNNVIHDYQNSISTVAAMDLTENEKSIIKRKLELKLFDKRTSSVRMMKDMIRYSSDWKNAEAENYISQIKAALSSIQQLSVTQPQ